MKPREHAEEVFNQWSKDGTLETDWMNPEDKEKFIGPMAEAIQQAVNDALDDYDRDLES